MPAQYVWTVPSPLGQLSLLSDGDCVTGLYMPSPKGVPHIDPTAMRDVGPFRHVASELDAYFSGNLTDFTVRVRGSGTPFQQRVWTALRAIPYGHTATYGSIAAAIGSPKAVRAVGLANGRNPISIIVPCHRVVGADGSLTGYGGGLANKEILLNLEQRVLADASPART
ncbi:MAG: methylated-DNA--[protein]-cysteine S-methyltransferase [Nitriliruptorales bacterium]|nr:methylated-DNA--[protein]-cysteine S-methyltransferase [Nitriliruptorales bacterium]